MRKAIENVGLSPNETKVYLALLELGNSPAGKISEKAEIHRRSTYDALNRLIEKGLASFIIKKKIRYYEVENPEKFKNFIKEKEENLKNQKEKIESVLPNLIEKYNKKKSNFEAKIYRGKEGLKTIMELILKERGDWLSIGSTGKGPTIIPYFLGHWHKRRLKQKIKLKSIVANNLEGKERGNRFLEMGMSEVKILPKEIKQPQTIWIFGNKVAIILVSISQPVIFLINNEEVAQSFRDYFKWIWNNAKNSVV